MLEDIQRLPRSISESDHWTPDWRNLQAMAYLAAYNERFPLRDGEGAGERFERALVQGIRFPALENDPIIKARFRHLAGAADLSPNWIEAFDIGEQLIRMNPETLEATSIKAWLLVRLSDEAIAAKHRLTPIQVRVVHDTWFDVRSHLSEPEVLLRVLCDNPPAPDPAGWQQRELKILWVALACGIETLDNLLNPADRLRTEYTDEELEWLADSRRRARAAVNREQAKAGKADANPNTEKFRQFTKGLLTACDRHGEVS